MRNVILFIKRYFNFLIFLGLQVFCLLTLFRYNSFHHAVFAGVSNELTGKINERYERLHGYFLLRKTNEELLKENQQLRSLLRENFEAPDSLKKLLPDSVIIKADSTGLDSLFKSQKYEILEATVAGNSVSQQKNYVQIHRGALQGIRNNMGVISPTGVVGKVVEVTDNFSVIMSLLNRDSRISAMLKRSGEVGFVSWEGNDPQILTLSSIPKSATVIKGDSIITSGFTTLYPRGMLIGTVTKVEQDKTTNTFSLSIKPATNFYTLQYVYVLNNLQRAELDTLENRIKKKQ